MQMKAFEVNQTMEGTGELSSSPPWAISIASFKADEDWKIWESTSLEKEPDLITVI